MSGVNPKTASRLTSLLGLAITLIGVLGIIGFYLDIDVLQNYAVNGSFDITPGVSGAFILLGLVIHCLLPADQLDHRGHWHLPAQLLLLSILLGATSIMVKYLLQFGTEIRLLFHTDIPTIGVAFLSAFKLALVSGSLFGISRRPKSTVANVMLGVVGLVVLELSLFSMVGHWFAVPVLYSFVQPMPSSIAFLMMGLVLLIGTIHSSGLLSPLSSELRRVNQLALAGIVLSQFVVIVGVAGVSLLHSLEVSGASSWRITELIVWFEYGSIFISILVLGLSQRSLHYFEHALQARGLFESTFRQAAVGITLVDREGYLKQVNQKFCDIFGYADPSELIGVHYKGLQYEPDLDKTNQLFNKLVAREIPNYSLEKRYVRKDGSLLWARATASISWNAEGKFDYMIGVVEDISARKNAEAANMRKTRIMAYVAHDFKNPIDAMLRLSEILGKNPQTQSNPDQLEMVDYIKEGLQQLRSMVTNILDRARMEEGRLSLSPSQFAIRPLLEDLSRSLASACEQHSVSMTIDIDERMDLIEADRAQLRQILLNLLSNAVKYNKPYGQVYLRAQTSERGHQAIFEIEDTGHGISEEGQQHLFADYYRGEYHGSVEGSGLGLAFSRKLVELHGGQITLESHLNQGSIFRVVLPQPLPNPVHASDPETAFIEAV